MQRNYFSVLVFMFILGLSGCVAPIKGLYQDSSFTYPNIQASGIAVAGVTSSVNKLSTATQVTYGNLVYDSLIDHLPGVAITTPGNFASQYGKNACAKLMSSYTTYRTINNDVLQAVHIKLAKSRYLVIANIDSNKVANGREEWADVNRRENISYTTKRSIQVTLQVYDLLSASMVWSGSITDGVTNSNDYEVPGLAGDSFHHHNHRNAGKAIIRDVVSTASTLLVDTEAKNPAAPTTSAVLKKIFDNYASNFQKMNKK
jgi:hypothetical protein